MGTVDAWSLTEGSRYPTRSAVILHFDFILTVRYFDLTFKRTTAHPMIGNTLQTICSRFTNRSTLQMSVISIQDNKREAN